MPCEMRVCARACHQVVRAKRTVDCTGDADVAYLAGDCYWVPAEFNLNAIFICIRLSSVLSSTTPPSLAGCRCRKADRESQLGVTTVFNASGVDKPKFLEYSEERPSPLIHSLACTPEDIVRGTLSTGSLTTPRPSLSSTGAPGDLRHMVAPWRRVVPTDG